MLTHSDELRILKHFYRLRDEAHIPAYRARHIAEAPGTTGSGDDAIVLDDSALERFMPKRFSETKLRKLTLAQGYVDTAIMAAAQSPLLRKFGYLWFVEYDVDFAGRWSDVFDRYRDCEHGLIGFRICSEADSPKWTHWSGFKSPSGASRYCSFVPIMRLSRPFIEHYIGACNSGEWEGHIEAMLPSIALSAGTSILDMGAGYEFSAGAGPALLNHKTFGYRPPRASSYFHEDKGAFSGGLLHHPIKITW